MSKTTVLLVEDNAGHAVLVREAFKKYNGDIQFNKVSSGEEALVWLGKRRADVILLDLNTQDKVVYQLLGVNDADIDTGSISIHSPVGEAIVGLSVGDKASVTIPRGEFCFEVIDIAKSQIQ